MQLLDEYETCCTASVTAQQDAHLYREEAKWAIGCSRDEQALVFATLSLAAETRAASLRLRLTVLEERMRAEA